MGFRRVLGRAALATAVLLGPVATTGCGADEARRAGPDGAAFYRADSELKGLKHGDLIWSRPYHGAWALKHAENRAVLYAQQGIHRKLVATSGIVAIPRGKAPAGGWPVVTWAHGTTGIADACAPSRDNGPSPLPRGRADTKDLLQGWIDSGHAVVMTDYEGLGTPGAHPYLIGPSEGRAVLDIVRTAREYSPRLGDRVLVAGHSQGGHAAVWAASMMGDYTAELRLVGTVAFAPVSHMSLGLQVGLDGQVNVSAALIALLVRGLQVAYPSQVRPAQLLSAAGMGLYPATLRTCISGLTADDVFGDRPAYHYARRGADVTEVKGLLDANDPSFPSISGPILLLQGGRDTTIPQVLTDALAKAYHERGLDVRYQIYPRADHNTVLPDSRQLVSDFTRKAFSAAS